jgi:uncharacterized protein YndB with AHSA1/START domain
MSASLADDELLIVRAFDAPAALVFAMWSQPEHFKRWFGPEGFECDHCEMDFRVGGAYRAMIRSPDAGENWFSGTYLEIRPSQRLVFTFTWNNDGPSAQVETRVTITFTEREGRTEQTFHQTPFLNAERRDSHVGGWTSTFGKLAACVAALTMSYGEAR